ncbi:IclR family transcriptional regulator [Candidatus Protofrankia californiensis]|uniref:IclR family transcriptional regulator n=1 Tax=Candidatus Protofrankia californiensis TaxID=1839754 RepID=UPI001040EC71|nr:IclR family transcriptional regulator [Candidatus Protofrankia californiensis]
MTFDQHPTATGAAGAPDTSGAAGVQSVQRALTVLEVVEAAHGACSISEMATATGLPLPTIHRLVQTLAARGYLRRLPDRRYCLGSRLVPLGAGANALLGERAGPVLRGLADQLGESVNLAVLAGSLAEYVAQAPGSHSMRTFTEVGRRVSLYCTGVGKALLAMLPPDRTRTILETSPLTPRTPATITDIDELLSELSLIRSRGHALDEGEMEIGVRCVAVPVPAVPLMAGSPMAVSVSGPTVRMTDELVERTLPALARTASELADVLV